MTVKRPCKKCKHFIMSTKECSNIEAVEQMINGVAATYKVGCDKQEEGVTEVE